MAFLMGILLLLLKKGKRTVLRLSFSKASKEKSVWRAFPNLVLPGKIIREE